MPRSNRADQSNTNSPGFCQSQDTDHQPGCGHSPDSDLQAAELDYERAKLVQTVRDIRTRSELADGVGIRRQAQRLLSAAMEDLARHDAALGPDSEEAI